MVMHINFKKFIKNIAIPLGVGVVSGFLTRGGVESFNQTANKPFFMPPGWLFPVAWTVLYILMGIATYFIDLLPKSDGKKFALRLYYIQLFFNFWWSFIFFSFGQYLFAFIWLSVMFVIILATTLQYKKLEPKSSYFMIPYILWVIFAGVLNFNVYLLN